MTWANILGKMNTKKMYRWRATWFWVFYLQFQWKIKRAKSSIKGKRIKKIYGKKTQGRGKKKFNIRNKESADKKGEKKGSESYLRFSVVEGKILK